MTTRRFLAVALAMAAVAWTPNAQAADFPKGSPKFEKRYRSALNEAKKSGKPVIAVFSAVWCGPCQQMKKEVYPSEAVKPFHDKFVWVYLDTDDGDNEKIANEFKVQGIPHIQFLDKEGKPLDKQIGGMKPEAFAQKLESVLKKAGPAPAAAKPAA